MHGMYHNQFETMKIINILIDKHCTQNVILCCRTVVKLVTFEKLKEKKYHSFIPISLKYYELNKSVLKF